jgi:hypothetical protein
MKDSRWIHYRQDHPRLVGLPHVKLILTVRTQRMMNLNNMYYRSSDRFGDNYQTSDITPCRPSCAQSPQYEPQRKTKPSAGVSPHLPFEPMLHPTVYPTGVHFTNLCKGREVTLYSRYLFLGLLKNRNLQSHLSPTPAGDSSAGRLSSAWFLPQFGRNDGDSRACKSPNRKKFAMPKGY